MTTNRLHFDQETTDKIKELLKAEIQDTQQFWENKEHAGEYDAGDVKNFAVNNLLQVASLFGVSFYGNELDPPGASTAELPHKRSRSPRDPENWLTTKLKKQLQLIRRITFEDVPIEELDYSHFDVADQLIVDLEKMISALLGSAPSKAQKYQEATRELKIARQRIIGLEAQLKQESRSLRGDIKALAAELRQLKAWQKEQGASPL